MARQLDITRRYHEQLLEVVRTALPFITSSRRDADLPGLAHLRTEMVAVMDAYCRHVHRLRDRAREAGNGPALARAETLVTGCIALQSAYHAFRRRWVHRNAMENWPEYRLSAIVMMKQLRNHIQQAELVRAGELPLAA